MNRKNILAGMLGALIVVLLLILIIVWIEPFNYQAIFILNPQTVVTDSLNLSSNQIAVLQDLERKGILLTPHEYTSRITSYYNTLVGFLIGLFILFSFVGFLSIKNTAKKDIEDAKGDIKETIKNELLDSKDLYKEVSITVKESMRETILTKSDIVLVEIHKKLKELEDKQEDVSVEIELINDELGIGSKLEIKE